MTTVALAAELITVIVLAAFAGFAGVMLALFIFWWAGWFTQLVGLWGRDQRRPLLTFCENRVSSWELLRRPRMFDVAWVVAGVAALWLLGQVGARLYSGSSSAAADPTLATWTAIVAGDKGLLPQIAYIVLIVGVGPLFEEIAWRAYALRGLQSVLTRSAIAPGVARVVAVAFSAVAFGAVHTHYSLFAQLMVGLSGFVYGLLLIRTQNLLLAVLAHSLYNGLWVAGCLIA